VGVKPFGMFLVSELESLKEEFAQDAGRLCINSMKEIPHSSTLWFGCRILLEKGCQGDCCTGLAQMS